MMAAGVNSAESLQVWPAARQAARRKSVAKGSARSCRSRWRMVEIRRCIAGPPVPTVLGKKPMVHGGPGYLKSQCCLGLSLLTPFPFVPFSPFGVEHPTAGHGRQESLGRLLEGGEVGDGLQGDQPAEVGMVGEVLGEP